MNCHIRTSGSSEVPRDSEDSLNDLEKSIKHIVASDVNKKWGKYMSDILKVDIDPKTNFPYLLPIQMHLD